MLCVLIISASASGFYNSNEYPQHMFSWRNKKISNTFWLKKVPYQKLSLYLEL